MGDSGHSVYLIIKRKQGNPTPNNLGGRSSHIYSWSKIPMDLVPTPCLAAEYTDIPNVLLQITTKKEHQRLSMSNAIRCAPLMSAPYIYWFGLHVMISHSDYGHQLKKTISLTFAVAILTVFIRCKYAIVSMVMGDCHCIFYPKSLL